MSETATIVVWDAVGNVTWGVREWDEPIAGVLIGAVAGIACHFAFSRGHRDMLRGLRTAHRGGVAVFVLSGILTIIAQACLIAAMKVSPVALVALITLCTPLLVFPMSYFFLGNDEGINARTLAGEVFPVEISVSRVRLSTERLYTAIVRDIRERRAHQNRLQYQATHDSLTGLPNRAALLAHLDGAFDNQAARPAISIFFYRSNRTNSSSATAPTFSARCRSR